MISRRERAGGLRPAGDVGFTLVEVMVVVAIITVLMVIGLVAYVGFRESAQDRAAPSDLRNVLLAEKMIWQESAVYTDVIADVEAAQPGSPIAADPAEGVYIDLNDEDGQIVCLVRASGSSRFFSVWDSARDGAFYGDTDLSAADCPAAVPDGYTRPGF